MKKIRKIRIVDLCLAQTNGHPFNGLSSRTAGVSWRQNGQTNLDFNAARDDGVTVASVGPYRNHLHLAPDR